MSRVTASTTNGSSSVTPLTIDPTDPTRSDVTPPTDRDQFETGSPPSTTNDAELWRGPPVKLTPQTFDVSGKLRRGLDTEKVEPPSTLVQLPTLDLSDKLAKDDVDRLIDLTQKNGPTVHTWVGKPDDATLKRMELVQQIKDTPIPVGPQRESVKDKQLKEALDQRGEPPTFLKKAAWVLGTSALTGVKDYLLYNIFRPDDGNEKVSPLYRVEQGVFQAFTGLTLAKNLGLGAGLAYGSAQWSGAIDMFGYYGTAALVGKEKDPHNPRWEHKDSFSEVVAMDPTWFQWTPVGIFNSVFRDKHSVSGKTMVWQSATGLVVGTGLLVPSGGLLGTPLKDVGWFDRLTPFIPTF